MSKHKRMDPNAITTNPENLKKQRLCDALLFAHECHKDQKRKYTGEPYIKHPLRVMASIQRHTKCVDDEVLAAAVLHDVVEDCGIQVSEIRQRFGDNVAQWVDELTDKSKPSDGNRKTRKAIDNARLSHVSMVAQNIKLADILDNCFDIALHDKDFARVYVREKLETVSVLTAAHFQFRVDVVTHLERLVVELASYEKAVVE